MLTYPAFNPVAFHIFSWPVYWYGLMYLVGFLGGWMLISMRLRLAPWHGFTQDQLSDMVFFTALGGIIGGRLGYILFYDTQVIFSNPLLILQTWKGGMSIHGGFIGATLGIYFCGRKIHKRFLEIADFVAPAVPLGLGAGRFGNFINGELWGRVTNMPWGMVFPGAGPYPRHPSQLYEIALEGVVLFVIVWLYSRKPRPLGAVTGLFLLIYGVFRFTIECFREADAQIGYFAHGLLTEGQLLSLPMILIGVLLLRWAYRTQHN